VTTRPHCYHCANRSLSICGARCTVDGRNLMGNRRSLACVTGGWHLDSRDLLDRLGKLTHCTPRWYARVTGLPESVVRVRLFGEHSRGAELLAMMAWIVGATVPSARR